MIHPHSFSNPPSGKDLRPWSRTEAQDGRNLGPWMTPHTSMSLNTCLHSDCLPCILHSPQLQLHFFTEPTPTSRNWPWSIHPNRINHFLLGAFTKLTHAPYSIIMELWFAYVSHLLEQGPCLIQSLNACLSALSIFTSAFVHCLWD